MEEATTRAPSARTSLAPQQQQGAGNTAALSAEEQISRGLENQLSLSEAAKVKARKPYTLTKQRERWTDEEHGKFLEALKLYGRAWRKIEEHVSTKTAVQIRSHAQKFISKLERNKDTCSTEDGTDITIPPPRPKRKPARPYPRKESAMPDNSGSAVADASDVANGHGGAVAQQQNSKPSLPAAPRSSSQPCMTHSDEVTEATVAAVAAAASAAAAAAAAAVVAAAGQQVQSHLQAHPPLGFPFFGVPPSLLAQVTLQNPALEAFIGSGAGLARVRDNASFRWQHRVQDGPVQQLLLPVGGGCLMAEAMATTTDGDNALDSASGPESRGSDGNSFCSREGDETQEAAVEQPQSGRQPKQAQPASQPVTQGHETLAAAQYWQLLGMMDGTARAQPSAAPHSGAMMRHHHDALPPVRSGSGGGSGRIKGHTERDQQHKKQPTRSLSYSGNTRKPNNSNSVQDAKAGGRRGDGSSADTNGSDSAFKAAGTDQEIREAQGSNPTNFNNGNGNGHSSGNGSAGANASGSGSQGHGSGGHGGGSGSQGNGNGSSGNGNGSTGNGDGSSGNGNGSSGNGNGSSGNGNGSSGNGHSGGNGSSGNGKSIKDSNTPDGTNNGTAGYSSGNGTSHHHHYVKHFHHHHHHHHGPTASRPPAYDAGRYPKHHETQDNDGNGASGIGTRPPSSEEEDNVAVANTGAAASAHPHPPGVGLGLGLGLQRGSLEPDRPMGQPGHTSAFSVPQPSARSDISNVHAMLTALQQQSHALQQPYLAGGIPAMPPTFAQQALSQPGVAAQPFFSTATAAASAIMQRSMLGGAGPGAELTPAAAPSAAAATVLPAAYAHLMVAAAAQLQQQQQHPLHRPVAAPLAAGRPAPMELVRGLDPVPLVAVAGPASQLQGGGMPAVAVAATNSGGRLSKPLVSAGGSAMQCDPPQQAVAASASDGCHEPGACRGGDKCRGTCQLERGGGAERQAGQQGLGLVAADHHSSQPHYQHSDRSDPSNGAAPSSGTKRPASSQSAGGDACSPHPKRLQQQQQ